MPLEFLQQLEQMDRLPAWMEAIYRNKRLASARSTSPREAMAFLAASRGRPSITGIPTSVPSPASFKTSTKTILGKKPEVEAAPSEFKSEEEARKYIEKTRAAMGTLSGEVEKWQNFLRQNEGKRIPSFLWGVFHKGGINTRRQRKLANEIRYRTRIDDRLASLQDAISQHQANIQAAQAWLDQQSAAREAARRAEDAAIARGQMRNAYMPVLNAFEEGRKPTAQDVPIPYDPNAFPGSAGNAVPILNEMLLRGLINKDEFHQLLSGAQETYATPKARHEMELAEREDARKAAQLEIQRQNALTNAFRAQLEKDRLLLDKDRFAASQREALNTLTERIMPDLGGNYEAAQLVARLELAPDTFKDAKQRDAAIILRDLWAYRKAGKISLADIGDAEKSISNLLQKKYKIPSEVRDALRRELQQIQEAKQAATIAASATPDEFLLQKKSNPAFWEMVKDNPYLQGIFNTTHHPLVKANLANIGAIQEEKPGIGYILKETAKGTIGDILGFLKPPSQEKRPTQYPPFMP